MPDEIVIPVEVVLKDESDKKVDSVTIDVPPGEYIFKNLSPGNYTTTVTPPAGYTVDPPNPWSYHVPEGSNILPVHIIKTGDGLGLQGEETGGGSSPESPPPPSEDQPLSGPALITLAAASTLLMGNLAFLDPFISPTDPLSRLFSNGSTQPRPSNPSSSPGSSRNGDRPDLLSPQIQAQVRTCLKANIERILGVPSLSELATALLGEDAASITETQRQIRALYKTVNELYKLISECDPSFIQELLKTEDPEGSDNPDGNAANPASPLPSCVKVIVERVNIRASPSLDSTIIAQALFGTCFQVDLRLVAGLSAQQRLAITMGEDWYPVILRGGNRGYIFSRYVTEVAQQCE